ncbi:MAG: polysialyltransferase family glycosyltransferase [Campylobacterota bacterium]|nr:polysialyltransferase family glycosyltransferase [Campylobacterota bacterium]
MNSNLFIVRSPLQLLNAIEAKNHFQTKNNILVVLYNKNSNANDPNNIQLTQLLDIDTWDTIYEHNKSDFKSASGLKSQVKIIKSLKKLKFDYLFSGDYGVIHQVFISTLDAKEIFLLDDGTLTLTMYKNDLDPNYKGDSFGRRFKLFRYRFFGLKTRHTKPINFFTCFQLDPVNGKKIVSNNYSFLRKNYLPNVTRDDETIYFLGTPLVKGKFIDEAVYIRYLQKCIDTFEKPILYIPHRAEIMTDAFKALEGEKFSIGKSTGPIELRFLLEKRYPLHLYSFFSTALYTLNHIFPQSEIVSIKFKSEEILKDEETILNKYHFFDTTSVSVISLDI